MLGVKGQQADGAEAGGGYGSDTRGLGRASAEGVRRRSVSTQWCPHPRRRGMSTTTVRTVSITLNETENWWCILHKGIT